MIDVQELTYTYPAFVPGGARTTALDRVSFHVDKGQYLAITGPNNCGKTTLCLTVAGLAPRLTEGRLTGRVLIGERDVQAEKPGMLADRVGLLMQEPAGQMFNRSVEHEIAWGLENLGISPAEMEARIKQTLAMVGLEHVPRDQPPLSLSGGEQKRLALASALALEPEVLILDEPAGGLSPLGRREMAAILSRLRHETGLTILLAESDPDLIIGLADEMLVMVEGKIVQRGTPREIYAELDPIAAAGVVLPPSLIFAQALDESQVVPITIDEAAELASKYPKPTPSPEPFGSSKQPPRLSEDAIVLDHVTFGYEPKRPILRDITLHIGAGEFIALTGDNGAGKTTLARHLVGLLRSDRGQVFIQGQNIAGMSIGQIARMVGFAYQNPELQIFNPTVREEIAFGPHNLGMSTAEIEQTIEDALTQFGLKHVQDSPPSVLSFSARRLVALASIAAMRSPTLVLDEPTIGLDVSGQGLVMEWFTRAHDAGTTVLFITHDMELAARYAERIVVLDDGEITADGSPAEVFKQGDVVAHAGLEAPFAIRLAQRLGDASLAAALTPESAARLLRDRV